MIFKPQKIINRRVRKDGAKCAAQHSAKKKNKNYKFFATLANSWRPLRFKKPQRTQRTLKGMENVKWKMKNLKCKMSVGFCAKNV